MGMEEGGESVEGGEGTSRRYSFGSYQFCGVSAIVAGEKHGCSHSASRSGSFSCSPRTSLGWQRAGARLPCLRAPRTLCCSGRRCWRPGSGSRRPGGRGRGTGGRGGAGSGSPWGRVYTAVVTRRGRSLGGEACRERRASDQRENKH